MNKDIDPKAIQDDKFDFLEAFDKTADEMEKSLPEEPEETESEPEEEPSAEENKSQKGTAPAGEKNTEDPEDEPVRERVLGRQDEDQEAIAEAKAEAEAAMEEMDNAEEIPEFDPELEKIKKKQKKKKNPQKKPVKPNTTAPLQMERERVYPEHAKINPDEWEKPSQTDETKEDQEEPQGLEASKKPDDVYKVRTAADNILERGLASQSQDDGSAYERDRSERVYTAGETETPDNTPASDNGTSIAEEMSRQSVYEKTKQATANRKNRASGNPVKEAEEKETVSDGDLKGDDLGNKKVDTSGAISQTPAEPEHLQGSENPSGMEGLERDRFDTYDRNWNYANREAETVPGEEKPFYETGESGAAAGIEEISSKKTDSAGDKYKFQTSAEKMLKGQEDGSGLGPAAEKEISLTYHGQEAAKHLRVDGVDLMEKELDVPADHSREEEAGRKSVYDNSNKKTARSVSSDGIERGRAFSLGLSGVQAAGQTLKGKGSSFESDIPPYDAEGPSGLQGIDERAPQGADATGKKFGFQTSADKMTQDQTGSFGVKPDVGGDIPLTHLGQDAARHLRVDGVELVEKEMEAPTGRELNETPGSHNKDEEKGKPDTAGERTHSSTGQGIKDPLKKATAGMAGMAAGGRRKGQNEGLHDKTVNPSGIADEASGIENTASYGTDEAGSRFTFQTSADKMTRGQSELSGQVQEKDVSGQIHGEKAERNIRVGGVDVVEKDLKDFTQEPKPASPKAAAEKTTEKTLEKGTVSSESRLKTPYLANHPGMDEMKGEKTAAIGFRATGNSPAPNLNTSGIEETKPGTVGYQTSADKLNIGHPVKPDKDASVAAGLQGAEAERYIRINGVDLVEQDESFSEQGIKGRLGKNQDTGSVHPNGKQPGAFGIPEGKIRKTTQSGDQEEEMVPTGIKDDKKPESNRSSDDRFGGNHHPDTSIVSGKKDCPGASSFDGKTGTRSEKINGKTIETEMMGTSAQDVVKNTKELLVNGKGSIASSAGNLAESMGVSAEGAKSIGDAAGDMGGSVLSQFKDAFKTNDDGDIDKKRAKQAKSIGKSTAKFLLSVDGATDGAVSDKIYGEAEAGKAPGISEISGSTQEANPAAKEAGLHHGKSPVGGSKTIKVDGVKIKVDESGNLTGTDSKLRTGTERGFGAGKGKSQDSLGDNTGTVGRTGQPGVKLKNIRKNTAGKSMAKPDSVPAPGSEGIAAEEKASSLARGLKVNGVKLGDAVGGKTVPSSGGIQRTIYGISRGPGVLAAYGLKTDGTGTKGHKVGQGKILKGGEITDSSPGIASKNGKIRLEEPGIETNIEKPENLPSGEKIKSDTLKTGEKGNIQKAIDKTHIKTDANKTSGFVSDGHGNIKLSRAAENAAEQTAGAPESVMPKVAKATRSGSIRLTRDASGLAQDVQAGKTSVSDLIARGVKAGGTKDVSGIEYDANTGRVTDAGNSPSTPGSSGTASKIKPMNANEAVFHSRSIHGQGIVEGTGKHPLTMISKNGEGIRIGHAVRGPSVQMAKTGRGAIKIGTDIPGIMNPGEGQPGISAQIGDKFKVGKHSIDKGTMKIGRKGATNEYYELSAKKDGIIRLSRDGEAAGGRAQDLYDNLSDDSIIGKINNKNSKLGEKTRRGLNARNAKMHVGPSSKVAPNSGGPLSSQAADAKEASRGLQLFRQKQGMNMLGQQAAPSMGTEAVTQTIGQTLKKTFMMAAKKIVTGTLISTLVVGGAVGGQAAVSKFNDIQNDDVWYPIQAHRLSDVDDENSPVMTQNVLTKMQKRMSAYSTLISGGTVDESDDATKDLHDIEVTKVTVDGSSVDPDGFTIDNIGDYSRSHTYRGTMVYPEDVYDPVTGEIIVDYPSSHASSHTETLKTSSPMVTFEFVDRYGNVIESTTSTSTDNGQTGEDNVNITATGDAKKILEIASSHVGGPYEWGGNNWTTGVDDSHFVTKVLTEAGVYHGGYLTSDEWQTAGRKVSGLDYAQAGDVICYDGHVAIFDGDTKVYDAKGEQWGITHDQKADHDTILAIRRFIPDGATGSATVPITGNGATTTSGETINVPSGLGDLFTFMGWQMVTDTTSQAYKLREESGMKFDSEGFGIIDGRYVIACTTTFGDVGDLVDFYQTDGTVLHTIIGDTKNQDDDGCNEWGHQDGHGIVEFIVDKNTWYGGKKDNVGTTSNHPELGGKYITKAVNIGSWFNGTSGASSLSTAGFGQTQFFKSILSMSALGGYYDNPWDVEKYNQYCYDLLDYSVADWNLGGVEDFDGTLLSSRGGLSVEYNMQQTGNKIEWSDDQGGTATANEYAMSCTVKIQVLTDLRYMERADATIIKNFTGWDWKSFNTGDQLPLSYMDLETSVFDEVFNVKTAMFGGGAMFTGVEKQVYDFFAAKGLGAAQIAGIMANIFRESSFDPTCINASSGASGLFQWLGDRLTSLKQYAASKGTDWTDVQTQLEYAWKEIDGLDGWNYNSSARNTFFTTDDPYTAGATFGHYWERYGSSEEDDRRGKKAEYYYSIIMSVGSGDIVSVALSQVGNVGGQPYWSWYGFDGYVSWCACFVSWCANQCGYIDAGVIPKFASCTTGSQWFKNKGQWRDRSFTPSTGHIIFFDWDVDGQVDHVGIVERVENGRVYTVEGNSHNECRRKDYALGSSIIYGYATPAY